MNKDELSLLKQAITNEVEGYTFYKLAAAQAVDAEVRESMLLLAKEEENHAQWLRELLKKSEIGEQHLFDLTQIEVESPHIFDLSKLKDQDIEQALAVFKIGLGMEKASAEFYEAGENRVTDDKVKGLFRILSAWEWGHYKSFNEEYELLLKEYWNDQEYAPF